RGSTWSAKSRTASQHGLSTKEARRTAMRAMYGLEQRTEEMRDMRRIHWLTDFLDDARYAIRSLRRVRTHRVCDDHACAGDRDDLDHFQHDGCADLQALPRAASGRRGQSGEHFTRQQLRRFLV